ncbi:MAG: ATPase, partial [Planctomycetes bacterium]|nr:ATPase [Planctomycetota bacterium]
MPDVDHDDSSLEGTCGTIVEKAFAEVIEGQDFLLTDEGQLTASEQSIIIPRAMFDVWPSAQAAALLDDEGRPAFSRHVSDENRTKLLNWNVIKEIDDQGVLDALQGKHLPRPESWRHLLNLWAYIAPAITGYRYTGREKKGLCVVPVQGKEVLCAADEVVRLGEKKLLPSEDDWQFLGDRLSVLNQNWLRYLTEQRRLAETNDNDELSERVDAAYEVLKAISLNEPSDTGKVIDQVAADFFGQKKVTLVDAIRIAQIAAKLGAGVGDTFRFVCQDRHLRSVSRTILFDADGTLDLLLPEEWSEEHLLHSDYLKSFTSCTREEWLRWVSSGRSGLQTFVPFEQTTTSRYWFTRYVVEELERRGFEGRFEPRYQNPSFRFNDWDFEEDICEHWETVAKEDSAVWGKIAEKILTEPGRFWSGSLSATVTEVASNGHTRRVIRDGLAPSWILKLRDKECLRDTHGVYRKPGELLRRTPETEALMDVEPFIHGLLDNETSRPLLKLLGVGEVPTGPDRLLGRLQALAKAENPPAHEVEKWYRRLDQMMDGCSTEDFNTIKNAFVNEKLVLAEKGTWENTVGVFLSSDEEDAPGAETVRASVRDLTLWR